jgi:chemotaxis protein MotB
MGSVSVWPTTSMSLLAYFCLMTDAILFDSGKATLKSATSKELDKILSVIKQKYASKEIDVVGHTDTDPIVKSSWKDNWELSAQRALSVTRYLIEHGIPEKQVRADACGSARPVASNASAEGKAKNRRVEIVVNLRQRSASPVPAATESKPKTTAKPGTKKTSTPAPKK